MYILDDNRTPETKSNVILYILAGIVIGICGAIALVNLI